MTKRSAFLTGAALGVFVVSATMAQATTTQATTTHHKKRHAAEPSKETLELKQQVQELQAKLQALESRLDAEASARRQTETQAQTAQATAQAAQSTALAAQTQVQADATKIETIPTQVETAAKANAPKPGWWNNTKLSGTVFADVSNIENKNAAGKTAQSGTDYDIKRTYLQVEHKFNDTYAFTFTTDLTFDSNTASPSGASSPTPNEAGGANTASGIKSTQIFVKYAFLQAHYSDAFEVQLGSAKLPWIPFVEDINGYRFVEQMLIDRTKFGTTTDWGVHINGTPLHSEALDPVTHKPTGGLYVGYAASVFDGEGFKQPSLGNVNRTNAVDVEGRLNAGYINGAKKITVAIGGYDGKLGKDVENVLTFNTAQRFDALGAYQSSLAGKPFTLGAEYFWARYWNDVTQASPSKTNVSDGYSLFGSANLTGRVSVFGRYDWVKPKANTAPSEHDNFFDVGVDYKPIPALDFALVYKRDSVTNGSFSTSDGVIGIPAGATTGEGTYDEIGIFTQVKF
jgi:hypothetical protein